MTNARLYYYLYLLSHYLFVLWLPYTVTCLLLLYGFLSHRRDYEHDFEPREIHSPRILFQVTTKGKEPQLVQRNVDSLHEVCRELGYHDYEVHVVTDGRERYENCTTLSVPEEYTCQKAVHKGRAFQYALEYRRENYRNLSEFWILHLDEESLVTRNVVMGCVEFIEENPGKLIAEGAINYPIRFLDTQLLIPSLLEAERSFGCYFCYTQMNLTPVWLHGSNLLVRADLEDEIGWEADSIAEDACFGYRVANAKGNVFGWTRGTLLEQPAFTIRDSFRQRVRWYRGSIQNMQFLSWKKRLLQYALLGTWGTGFFATFIGLPALLGILYVPEYLKSLLLFNLTFWIFTYVWGTWLNIRYLRIGRVRKASILFYCALISPFLGFFSTLPAVVAPFTRPKTFQIVRKS